MMGGGFDMKRMKEMRDKRQKEIRIKISKDLKMTPDQLKQYDALVKKENAEREKQFAAMSKGGGRPDFSKMRASMEKARDAHNAAMKKILKADQYTKYEKIMDDMRKQQRMRMGGPGGPGGPGAPGGPRPGGKTGA
jgi:hypothetical protein